MKTLTGRALLASGIAVMVLGSALLLLGEAMDSWAAFVPGLLVVGIGAGLYYSSGTARASLERRYRRFSRRAQFALLFGSMVPWLVLYVFTSPFWDFLLTAVLLAALSAAYIAWKSPPKVVDRGYAREE